MTSTLSLTDRWRRSWYLQRLELWLDPVPRRRRRALLGELRANLDEATADVGLAAAITDLGAPRTLAQRYLEALERHLTPSDDEGPSRQPEPASLDPAYR